MVLVLAGLMIVLILGAAGFVLHVLWGLALILAALWVLGFVIHAADTTASPRSRWYRW